MSRLELPRVVSALLRRAAPGMAEEIEGDLLEMAHGWAEEMGPARARRRAARLALRMIPGLAVARLRDDLVGPAWAGLSLDARLAGRLLVRHPGLTGIAVVALTVTMALATTLFTVTSEVLNAELPVPDGHRVVGVSLVEARSGRQMIPTWGEYRNLREGATTLDRVGGYSVSRLNVGRPDGPVQALPGAWVTPSVFGMVPTVALHGSVFTDAMVARDPGVVLLGERAWRDHFGGDPDIVGASVEVNGEPHRVVGVLPETWRFPGDEDLWVPLVRPAGAGPLDAHPGMQILGRLAEGERPERATSEASALITPATPLPDRNPQVTVLPFARTFTDGDEVPLMWALVGAMVLLVLVAAANVSNLVLARTEARRTELAVRSALGASRLRIVGQLFVEALAMTGVAAVLALLLARWALSWVETQITGVPYYVELAPQPRVFAFAVILAGLAATLAGVVPALRATRGGRARSVRGTAGTSFGRFSRSVIVAEIALSVAMLGTAFALGEAFLGYTRGSDTPLDDRQILTAVLYTPWQGELEDQAMGPFMARLQEGLRTELAAQGVRVAFTRTLPGTSAPRAVLEVEGESELRGVGVASVDQGFFEVLEVTPVQGRGLDARDFEEGAPARVLVNEPFVAEHLGGRNALGRRVRILRDSDTQDPWAEVVGVVPDLGMNPGDPEERAAVYRVMPASNYLTVMARGDGPDPLALVPALRTAAARVDPRVQVRSPALLKDAARDTRIILSIVGGSLLLMGAMAALLSAAGLYAVISFGVARRTREIGVRVALGASAGRVVSVIGNRMGRAMALGVVLGLGVGWVMLGVATGLVGPGLFDFMVRPRPVLHLGGPALLMLGAGVASVWSPLRRALAVEPAEALRVE